MKKQKANYDLSERTIPVNQYGYYSQFGRSTVFIDCPVCGEKRILVYIWSLYGSGKMCPKCKSKFTSIGCMRNTLWNGGRK